MRALLQTGLDDLEVNIVAGPANPNVKMLESEIENARQLGRTVNFSMRLIIDANMPELMAWADWAVTGGGSTCWELAFMGLPAVVIILADKQRAIAEGLESAGAAVNLGWHDDLSPSKIADALVGLAETVGVRKEMARRGRELVDGKGNERVLKELFAACSS